MQVYWIFLYFIFLLKYAFVCWFSSITIDILVNIAKNILHKYKQILHKLKNLCELIDCFCYVYLSSYQWKYIETAFYTLILSMYVYYIYNMLKNKRALLLIMLLIVILSSITFVACNKKVEEFVFSQNTYTLYLDGEKSFTPSFIGNSIPKYSLSSSNDHIVKIENNKIVALKEGIVKVVASTTNGYQTSAIVMVFNEKQSPAIGFESDGKYPVYFSATTEPATTSLTVRVAPGDLVVEPNLYKDLIQGYIFMGWYKDRLLENKFSFDVPIYGPTTLYPKFIPGEPIFRSEIDEDTGTRIILGFEHKTVPYTSVVFPTHHVGHNADGSTVTTVYSGIKEDAFKENQSLQSIVIPGSYKTIGKSAFENCKTLIYVELQDGIETVEESAFANNKALKRIKVLSNIKNQGSKIFSNNEKLENVELANIMEIGKDFFNGAKALKNISLPDSLKKIQDSAFLFSGLTEINLNQVNHLGNEVFLGSNSLANINGVIEDFEYIGSYPFGRTGLLSNDHTSWLLEEIGKQPTNGLVKYKNALIYACKPGIKKDYTIKAQDSISYIAGDCFVDCEKATVYFEGDSPPSIGPYAFGRRVVDNVIYPDVDILLAGSTYMTPFINKWLKIITVEGVEEYSAYSWALANKIYVKKPINSTSIEYGYRDEVRINNTGEHPSWEYILPGYRSIIINKYIKDPDNSATELNIISDLNTIKSIYCIGDNTKTPEVASLEAIKHFGLNDEDSTVAQYQARITKLTLPSEGYKSRTVINGVEEVKTAPTYFEDFALALPKGTITFAAPSSGEELQVADLEKPSSIKIYRNITKIYVSDVDKYKAKWNYQIYEGIILPF